MWDNFSIKKNNYGEVKPIKYAQIDAQTHWSLSKDANTNTLILKTGK